MAQTVKATLLPERFRRFPLLDATALVALFAFASAAIGFLVRDDVLIYGDHPGSYWLVWYTLNIAWPLHHRLIDWMPYWYAGYPELQFYPPGYVILAWLFNLATLGKLSTALIYEIVLFVAYALPGFTFYYTIRHLGFGRRAAVAAGLFGLTFRAIVGGTGVLFIGMVGSRLAFGLDALVLVWGIDCIEARGRRYLWLGTAALAFGILAHPYHQIGIVLALGLYILVRRLSFVRSATRLGSLILLAVGLDAFWLFPLFAHSSVAMIPVVRNTLDQVWRQITDTYFLPYALLALLALGGAIREKDLARRAFIIVLILLPPILGAAMIGDLVILVDRLHIYQIDAIRLSGEYCLALALLAAIGASMIGEWFSKIARLQTRAWFAAAVTLLIVLPLLVPFWKTADLFHPQENGEPRFLSQAIRDYDLTAFWDTLGAMPGRVLFTSFYSSLSARGGEPFPTTLPTLTPLFSNREMMGGTFTRWSPIVALMWVGETNPPVLLGESRQQDDRALFGVPLERLSDNQLYAYCQHFNVTTLVASVDDYQTRTFLDASSRFQSIYNNGLYFVYRVKDYDPTWAEAFHATVERVDYAGEEINVHVRAVQADANIEVKVYAYPLWQASTDDGRLLPVTRNNLGLVQITLPPGDDYTVHLRYVDGGIEQFGNVISILSTVSFLAVGLGTFGISWFRKAKSSKREQP